MTFLEEWYKIEPSIATRLEKWGEGWIRDSIDHNTFWNGNWSWNLLRE